MSGETRVPTLLLPQLQGRPPAPGRLRGGGGTGEGLPKGMTRHQGLPVPTHHTPHPSHFHTHSHVLTHTQTPGLALRATVTTQPQGLTISDRGTSETNNPRGSHADAHATSERSLIHTEEFEAFHPAPSLTHARTRPPHATPLHTTPRPRCRVTVGPPTGRWRRGPQACTPD